MNICHNYNTHTYSRVFCTGLLSELRFPEHGLINEAFAALASGTQIIVTQCQINYFAALHLISG